MSNPPSGLPSFQIPFHLSPPPPIPQPNLPLVGSSVYGPPPVPFILSHEPPPAIPHQAEQRDYNFGAAGFSCRPPLFVPNPTQKQMVDKPVQSKGDLALMYATAKAARNGITMEAPPSGHRSVGWREQMSFGLVKNERVHLRWGFSACLSFPLKKCLSFLFVFGSCSAHTSFREKSK